ncbi:TrmB family transcriptional regulator [Streptomyces gamaensis]|uniref:TrmB family transcriptional regulator n=1 Tax=Streptomyces gamaensis TaxID=1763542 RepID=A0ABW0Z7X8_9ACTN
MLLGCLGVTGEEERVYRFLLRGDEERAEAVGRALRLPTGTVRAALRRLEAAGLVRLTGDADEEGDGDVGEATAVDPAIGIERLVEESLAALRQRMRDVDAVRSAVAELAREYGKGNRPPAPDIEHLGTAEETWARVDDLSFFAREEVMAVHPSAPWRPQNIEAARPLDLRCLRRGLAYRMVVLREAVQDPLTRAYFAELARAGARIRCVDEPIQRMAVYDRAHAVVPLDPGENRRGAVVVRQPGLVAGLVGLFERTWEAAVDLDVPAGNPLSALDRRVLDVLARVDKDEAAARELGVSLGGVPAVRRPRDGLLGVNSPWLDDPGTDAFGHEERVRVTSVGRQDQLVEVAVLHVDRSVRGRHVGEDSRAGEQSVPGFHRAQLHDRVSQASGDPCRVDLIPDVRTLCFLAGHGREECRVVPQPGLLGDVPLLDLKKPSCGDAWDHREPPPEGGKSRSKSAWKRAMKSSAAEKNRLRGPPRSRSMTSSTYSCMVCPDSAARALAFSARASSTRTLS